MRADQTELSSGSYTLVSPPVVYLDVSSRETGRSKYSYHVLIVNDQLCNIQASPRHHSRVGRGRVRGHLLMKKQRGVSGKLFLNTPHCLSTFRKVLEMAFADSGFLIQVACGEDQSDRTYY